MFDSLKVFYGDSNPGLAGSICHILGVEPGARKIHHFSNQSIKVKIEDNVRNDDVFVIQTAAPPLNDHLMELLIFIDALHYASAGRITVVMPYYFYSRSDKKDEPRISITARLVADLLQTAGADRILTMKLHSPQIMGFARIPMDQLLATGILTDYFRTLDLSNMVIAAPDVGSAKGARIFAKALNLPMVILDKERTDDRETVAIQNLIGDANGKDVLIVDDEILTGRSIFEATNVLKAKGAQKIRACCTHGFFTQDAIENLETSEIERIVITDTIPLRQNTPSAKIKVLSVANLFADAIRAIHEGTSVGALFS